MVVSLCVRKLFVGGISWETSEGIPVSSINLFSLLENKLSVIETRMLRCVSVDTLDRIEVDVNALERKLGWHLL